MEILRRALGIQKEQSILSERLTTLNFSVYRHVSKFVIARWSKEVQRVS